MGITSYSLLEELSLPSWNHFLFLVGITFSSFLEPVPLPGRKPIRYGQQRRNVTTE
jgi:hypothetical protein